jgi:hypothetical protein
LRRAADTAEKPLDCSVIVLTRNRKDEVLHTLQHVDSQEGVEFEVIVVDNGSTDDTCAAIAARFPLVTICRLGHNVGIGARNRGAILARADILVFLDDDVYPASPHELARVRECVESPPGCCCVAFKVLNPVTGVLDPRAWGHPRNYELHSESRFDTDCITEGACAIVRKEFLGVGGYYDPLFIGEEGTDLALCLIKRGGRLVYDPAIAVYHSHSTSGRIAWRSYFYYARNDLWIAWRHLPVTVACRFLVRSMGMLALSGLRRGMLAYVFAGVFAALRDGKRTGVRRDPMSQEAVAHLRQLHSQRQSLWFSLKKHLRDRVL